MPSKRDIARSIDDLDTDAETVEEWADRFARDRAASGESIPIVDATDATDDTDATEPGVLVTTWENAHYSIEFRAAPEEIPKWIALADLPA